MPYAQMNQADKDELEDLIDRATLSQVLDALADICGDKGEHLRSNWQDTIQAREWERMGSRLSALAYKSDV